jgi:hypothetical protein
MTSRSTHQGKRLASEVDKLPYGKRRIRSQQFVPQDLAQEDVVGLVSGLEEVAADGSVRNCSTADRHMPFRCWRTPRAATPTHPDK